MGRFEVVALLLRHPPGWRAVHAVQLTKPEVGYRFESDQEVARETRRALLDRAVAERALLATAHLTQPFVRAVAG